MCRFWYLIGYLRHRIYARRELQYLIGSVRPIFDSEALSRGFSEFWERHTPVSECTVLEIIFARLQDLSFVLLNLIIPFDML